MRPAASTTSPRPIFLIIVLGFLVSSMTFFPGWMSNDSIMQYREARAGEYNAWHPVLMAWWWRQLDFVYQGPALFLIQNLLLYWGGWGVLANAIRRDAGQYAYLVPLLGLWPGFFFVLGQIWKDVAFASCLFMGWAIVINAYCWQRKTSRLEQCALIILLSFAVGVKINGIVAIPFLVLFWQFNERTRLSAGSALLASLITAAIFLIPYGIVRLLPVKNDSPIQYTQVYDLFAISVKTGENRLPGYINDRVQQPLSELKKMYGFGQNDRLFYGITQDLIGLRAPTSSDAAELQRSWLSAISSNPGDYLIHRLGNFLSLLRIGQSSAAHVATPSVVTNEFGIKFEKNMVSEWLADQPETHPWIFYPWLYLLLALISSLVLLNSNRYKIPTLLLNSSSLVFVATHFFIAPAADFRYLYYSYFCSAIVVIFAISSFRTAPDKEG